MQKGISASVVLYATCLGPLLRAGGIAEAAGSSKKARKESSDRNMIHVRPSLETEALENACSRLGSRVGLTSNKWMAKD
jgi:hypothetical protein